MKIRVLLLCLAVSACTDVAMTTGDGSDGAEPAPPPFTPRQPESSDSSDPCFAGSFLGLIGRDAGTIGIAETETFRIIRGDRPVTDEFVPSRVNALVDPAGMISTVYCG